MARLMMAAIERAGYPVFLASRFRSYDGAGSAERQARLRELGRRLAERCIRRLEKDPPLAWFTYHLYHKAPDWIGPRVARHFDIPYLVAEASHAPKQARGPWALGFGGATEAIGQADIVFVVNPHDAACLAPLFSRSDVAVPLPPFLELAPYRDAHAARQEHRRTIAQACRLDGAIPWLLSAAMMRADVKLASYRLLGRALEPLGTLPWTLIVAGDGPARPLVEEALRPLVSRVRFLGALPPEALPPFYAAADVMVWPAIGEAYGMALLEAQAAGCPVIAGRTGGVPAIVGDGRTGMLVPEDDAAAFGRAVRALLSDPGRRTDMRRECLATTLRNHGLDSAAETIGSALRRLTRERRPW